MANQKLSLNEVSQEFDLKEMFGDSLKDRDLRNAIGEAIIEKIINRVVDENKGVDGRKLKSPYSDSYRNSAAFKIHGKSPKDINMTLTGDMLGSIDILSSNSDMIKIGIKGDQAPKAYNHQTGDTLPKRPFFGLNNKEINEIKKDFIDEVRSKIGSKG